MNKTKQRDFVNNALRVYFLVRASRNGLTVKEIAEKENVDVRKVYYILNRLEEAYVPLYPDPFFIGNRKVNRWKCVENPRHGENIA